VAVTVTVCSAEADRVETVVVELVRASEKEPMELDSVVLNGDAVLDEEDVGAAVIVS
jgi:hypothetical protein